MVKKLLILLLLAASLSLIGFSNHVAWKVEARCEYPGCDIGMWLILNKVDSINIDPDNILDIRLKA